MVASILYPTPSSLILVRSSLATSVHSLYQEGARPQTASQYLEVDVGRGPAHAAIVVTPPATSSRDMFLTEQMNMHLVWITGQIFLKPILRFLLEPHL